MKQKLTLTESALNRLMNFVDELDAPPIADTATAGAELDAALEAPVGDLPVEPALTELVTLKGLQLG